MCTLMLVMKGTARLSRFRWWVRPHRPFEGAAPTTIGSRKVLRLKLLAYHGAWLSE